MWMHYTSVTDPVEIVTEDVKLILHFNILCLHKKSGIKQKCNIFTGKEQENLKQPHCYMEHCRFGNVNLL